MASATPRTFMRAGSTERSGELAVRGEGEQVARSLLSKIATSLSKPNAESFSAIENLYVLFGRQKHRLLIRPIAGTLELA